MARKLPKLQRALDAKALASVAYGEIASSIYFALGIVALHALGFTPWVLLVMGALFLLVSLSYAEGTASIPETGGAATFTSIAFNDLVGFATGFSPHALTQGAHLGTSPSWHGILFALPLAMLAYTGLETVSNLAEEAREPGVNLPRSLFSALTGVVVVTVLIAIVGISAFPARHGATALGTEWLRAPLMG